MRNIPTLAECNEQMRRHWDTGTYPTLVYVETTNACNAHCTYCLYDRMERPVETMTMEQWGYVVARVAERGLKIGAMFCFGEPLLDPGLFEKIRYGREQGVMTEYLGLNTNVSMLTPDKFDEILKSTGNITLSFVATGDAFNRLTGLDYDACYRNAVAFIRYRDLHRPSFVIEIGCNDVTGHDRGSVRKAFKHYRVQWARDAEIEWGENVINGIINRSVMYPDWTCDGYRGAMQIKPNGDCCFCAYDVVKSETRFANIFEHDWPEIEERFKAAWSKPNTLCQRCDFWWNYLQLKANRMRRGRCIDQSWLKQYQRKGEPCVQRS